MDKEVSVLEKTAEDLLAFLGAQVKGYPQLVGVKIEEQATLFGMRFPLGIGTPLPGLVSLRLLYLNDLGSHIGHKLGGVGGRDHMPAFDNPYPF